jgi:Xaa-Pro aminopeptidase
MKLKQFQSHLTKKDIQASIFLNLDSNKTNPNFYYFTQIDMLAILVISKKKKYLIVPKMELEKAQKIQTKKDPYTIITLEKKALTILLTRLKIKKLGLDYQNISFETYQALKKQIKFKAINTSQICEELRLTKTKEEINKIKKAIKIGDEIFDQLILNIKQFKTEQDISNFIKIQIFKNNTEPSFTPIIANAKNSSIPHHTPSNKKLSKGFLLMDFGVKYQGYCSDMTRTIYLGTPTQKEKSDYNKLITTQKKLITLCKENARIKDLEDLSRNELGDYPHTLGHGIGIDIHEDPRISTTSKIKLKNNMTITIEPGIYKPNKYGIRIEDDILINNNKPIQLTKSLKELITIK